MVPGTSTLIDKQSKGCVFVNGYYMMNDTTEVKRILTTTEQL